MTVELIDVTGGAIEVAVAPGDPALPTLVFLHEGLGTRAQWRDFPQRVAVAAGGHAIVVYSRHGYGRSAPVPLPRPATYMHHEADVVLPELVAHLGLVEPILVGHSDGASIALLYAGAGRPVGGLVLLAPHAFVEDVTVAAIRAAGEAFAQGDLRARLARYHDDVDVAFRGWNEVWLSDEFRAWNIEDRLARITAPVLVVQGDADPYGSFAQVDAIERGVGGAVDRLELAGAGHSPQRDAVETTLAAIAAFLRRVSAAEVSGSGP